MYVCGPRLHLCLYMLTLITALSDLLMQRVQQQESLDRILFTMDTQWRACRKHMRHSHWMARIAIIR